MVLPKESIQMLIDYRKKLEEKEDDPIRKQFYLGQIDVLEIVKNG